MYNYSIPISKFYVSIGIQSGCEKIVVGDDSGHHYTFMVKRGEGIVELHKKNHNAEQSSEYTIFFQMKISDFENLLDEVVGFFSPLVSHYYSSNKMNIGKMSHHNWLLQPMPNDGEHAEKILIITKRGRKFRINKKVDWSPFFQKFICPHEAVAHGSNIFFAYSVKNGTLKKQGFIYRPKIRSSEKSFFFVKDKTLVKTSREIWRHICHCLSKYDFPQKNEVLDTLYSSLSH